MSRGAWQRVRPCLQLRSLDALLSRGAPAHFGQWHVDLSALCTAVQTQGCCLAGLNMAVFLLIGKTSALTMNIAGVVKDWMLIGLSVLLYASPVTPLNLGGYFLAFLAGESCNQRNPSDLHAAIF